MFNPIYRLLFRSLLPVVMLGGCAISRGKRISEPVISLSSAGSAEFRQTTGAMLGQGYVFGNQIVTLSNGDKIFPAMLQAIHEAKRSIDFETYVYEDGAIARQLTEALAQKAAAGVAVNLILDAEGTLQMGKANVTRLKTAGASVNLYHAILWWDLRRYNNRTHRKLLIVDGKVGFIGGAGIADQWQGNAESPEHWRDNHYRVTGPVVAQLQGIFMDDWLKTSGTVLKSNRRSAGSAGEAPRV